MNRYRFWAGHYLAFFVNKCSAKVHHNIWKKQDRKDSKAVQLIKYTVNLGDKERFDKEQIGVKEPFPVTKCQFTS